MMSHSDEPLRVGPPGSAVNAELLRTLREQLRQATAVLSEIEQLAAAGPAADPAAPSTDLAARIRALEEDRDSLANQLVEAERQGSRVMSLYVVTYQLHASLEPEEVEATIGEIATDLLGAQSFVLLLRDPASGEIRIADRRGLELTPVAGPFAGPTYLGGHALTDETLASGRLYARSDLDEPTLAAIPFSIHGQVIGALMVFRLFSHRSRPLSEERELLDLVAAHAASALVAARAFATATRKLRTLEGLMSLLGGVEGDSTAGERGPDGGGAP